MFEQTLKDATSDSYLGDVKVVGQLVRQFVHNVLTFDTSALVGECHRMADIFAGMNSAYKSIPDWTNRDGIGRSAAAQYGIDPTQSTHAILRATFAMIATRVFGVVKAHHADDDAVWQPLIDRIVQDAAGALIGVSEAKKKRK